MTQAPDKYLSEISEQDKQAFTETAQQVTQAKIGFTKIEKIITKVKNEELTVSEGQKQIDEIVEEYDLPKF